jgi:hypothetical protein
MCHLARGTSAATIARMRMLTASPLVVLLALGVGCGHDDTPIAPACGDPLQVSLPNCSALDDAITNRASAQEPRAPSVTAPTEGQSVPRATPFTFAWTAPIASRPRLRAPRAMTLADELRRWTTLIPEAEAHCEPFSGRAYELRFRVGGATVLRRQQSATTWTPDARDWGILVAGGGGRTVELTVYTALFNNGQIGVGAGPFTPMAARRFALQ